MAAEPLAIPVIAGGHTSFDEGSCHRQENRSLQFGLIDIAESGEAQWFVSDGSGTFLHMRSGEPLPALVFIVEKRRLPSTIVIEVVASRLRQTLRNLLGLTGSADADSELDIRSILGQYSSLRTWLESTEASKDEQNEMQLLVQGCLLDQALYHGIESNVLHNRSPDSRLHIQDLLHRRVRLGLDELSDCFRLGSQSDEITSSEWNAFNQEFERLCYLVDVFALREHCEPAVRSGSIWVRHDAAFLGGLLKVRGSEVLQQYVLDLVQRTAGKDDSDITGHPVYTAIRLGDVEQLQACIANRASFSSFCCACSQDRTLTTPLTVAVCWRQPAIVRCLLQLGPTYTEGLPEAILWAEALELEEILHILRLHTGQTPQFAYHGHSHPATLSSYATGNLGAAPPSVSIQPWPAEEAQNRGISEIANGIAAIGCNGNTDTLPYSAFHSSETILPTQTWTSWTLGPTMASTQPVISPPSHMVQPSTALKHRMEVGRHAFKRLTASWQRLTRAMPTDLLTDLDLLADGLRSPREIWEAGYRALCQIFENRAPSKAVEVLQVLLVVDSLDMRTNAETTNNHHSDYQLWRTMLNPEQQLILDELVRLLLPRHHSSPQRPPNIGQIWRKQNLAQQVVSTKESRPGSREPLAPKGLRLHYIYNCHRRGSYMEDHGPTRTQGFATSMPVNEVATHHPYFSKQALDLTYSDLIDVEGLFEEPSFELETRTTIKDLRADAPWKDIKPAIVSILASWEISSVFDAIARVQLRFSLPLSDAAYRSAYAETWTGDKALENLEIFCSIAHHAADDSEVASESSGFDRRSHVSLIPYMKSWMQGYGAPKYSVSLDPRFLQFQGNENEFAVEPEINPDLLSSSVPSARHGRFSGRLQCLSLGCPKTFSNVSNRNKHMREGCTVREHKGYRCRNDGCAKVLTTKWYRNTHEQTRCRYRYEVSGNQFCWMDVESAEVLKRCPECRVNGSAAVPSFVKSVQTITPVC